MRINNSHIKTCFDLAKTSTVRRGKVGAILIKDGGGIVCKSTNMNIYGHSKKFSIHAEEYIIKKAEKMKLFTRFPKEKFSLLVVRWRPLTNKLGNAMPCINCQKILDNYNLNVYFSNYNGEIKQYK